MSSPRTLFSITFFPPSISVTVHLQKIDRKWQIDKADIHLIHSSGRWSNSAAQTDNTAKTTAHADYTIVHSLLTTMVTSIDAFSAYSSCGKDVRQRKRSKYALNCSVTHTLSNDISSQIAFEGSNDYCKVESLFASPVLGGTIAFIHNRKCTN